MSCSDDSVAEAEFVQSEMQKEAKLNPTASNIRAIVAKVDLSQPLETLRKQFVALSRIPGVRGVRQLLNWHDHDGSLRACERGDFITDKHWREGLGN